MIDICNTRGYSTATERRELMAVGNIKAYIQKRVDYLCAWIANKWLKYKGIDRQQIYLEFISWSEKRGVDLDNERSRTAAMDQFLDSYVVVR